mmetsp:Transcript_2507/g.5159  ORF Transcript_2507/g.5159 Transcript_2507/m.5159 type:complete len:223 (+) Transcript_2507:148-816(+)
MASCSSRTSSSVIVLDFFFPWLDGSSLALAFRGNCRKVGGRSACSPNCTTSLDAATAASPVMNESSSSSSSASTSWPVRSFKNLLDPFFFFRLFFMNSFFFSCRSDRFFSTCSFFMTCRVSLRTRFLCSHLFSPSKRSVDFSNSALFLSASCWSILRRRLTRFSSRSACSADFSLVTVSSSSNMAAGDFSFLILPTRSAKSKSSPPLGAELKVWGSCCSAAS